MHWVIVYLPFLIRAIVQGSMLSLTDVACKTLRQEPHLLIRSWPTSTKPKGKKAYVGCAHCKTFALSFEGRSIVSHQANYFKSIFVFAMR